jgi:hypothetical protein
MIHPLSSAPLKVLNSSPYVTEKRLRKLRQAANGSKYLVLFAKRMCRHPRERINVRTSNIEKHLLS